MGIFSGAPFLASPEISGAAVYFLLRPVFFFSFCHTRLLVFRPFIFSRRLLFEKSAAAFRRAPLLFFFLIFHSRAISFSLRVSCFGPLKIKGKNNSLTPC